MKLYCGIDLHSNNHWLTLINEHDERLVEQRLANDLSVTLAVLAAYREELEAIAVESTFNWYWLVDGLMQAVYHVKLVNTSAVRQYEGLKHRDDCDDAFHLAQLLRLGILPCGYIYPRRQRAVRDLLRHRCRLVRQRTMNVLAAKSCYARELNMKVSSAVMIGTKQQPWPAVAEPQIALVIDAHRVIIEALTQQIRRIETMVRQELKDTPAYRRLQTVNGIGPILAWTIGLEVGDIHRFARVGQFASYCRCVQSCALSNGKKKGDGDRKNGNAYLSWAFHEAAHFAVRTLPQARHYYECKSRQRSRIVAIRAIAHKLARACYYILRDDVPFDADKLFSH